MQPLPASQRLVRRHAQSADGTTIAYYVGGAGPDAPALVVAGGLAGHHGVWRHQLAYLGDRFRFLTWDYRGLYRSEAPRPAGARFGITAQLDDLRAVTEAAGLERFSLLGWSVGVQIAAEAFHALPGRVESLVMICGTAGRPLDVATGHRRWRRAWIGERLRRTVRTTARAPGLLNRASRSWLGRRALAQTLRGFGLLGPTVGDEVLAEIVEGLDEVDVESYAETLYALAGHDATAVLASIDVPALVLAGGQDPFAPAALAHQLARQLPCSEVLIVPSGRHFLFLEYPELVNLRLERFFQDVGLC
ncbi:MAG: alpha/beta hydrolase [Deltaproteobacteria bacterium]|nr:alpha/beta hydrolase [Deltaproteobacteria bacterium]